LILFSLHSCASIKNKLIVREHENACPHLIALRSLAGRADVETLLKRKQAMLENVRKDKTADELLFTLGLLYAHPDNPKKNYQKSLAFFKKVIKEYPSSVYAGEAKIWTGVIEDIQNAAKVDLEIEQKKKELGK